MPARLVPLNPGATRPIVLERPVVLIGRHHECDATLGHSRISRRHCCVAQIAGGLVLRDLGSRTGVRINGYPVDEASLEDGDEIAIGPILFRLEWQHSPAEPARPPAPGPPPPAAEPQAGPIDDDEVELDEDDLIPFDDD